MAERTTIEWTNGGATWNPVTGCSVVSPGCTNCYAMRLAGTRLQHHPSRAGLTRDTKAGPVWTGEVRLNEQWLDQPLRWQRPRMIFVVAHGDLFHEAVPDTWVDRVFAVMALAPQHTFQVLTKRPARARRYLESWPSGMGRIHWISIQAERLRPDLAACSGPDAWVWKLQKRWPLPNVWLGTSAEDQPRAEERVWELAHTPAAVRWVSAEPLLGPINGTTAGMFDVAADGKRAVDWVVAGGESGPGARRMGAAWARSLRDQCVEAGVAFHFKQWGHYDQDGRPVGKKAAGRELDGRTWDEWPS